MSALIELDHFVDLNGIAIRFVPIRQPTISDRTAATRAVSCKWRQADRKLVEVIAATIEASDPEKERKLAQGLVGCALVREVTGLPFTAIAQLGASDQAKISAFLNSSIEA